jgi:nitroreductase
MDVIKAIKGRRSIRKFKNKPIDKEKIKRILEAGRWAPSGLNNQPWKFCLIKNKDLKTKISSLTKSSSIVKSAYCLICVFLDEDRVYNVEKDLQSTGACIQNMLLAATSLGVGTCWLGEILNERSKVQTLLKTSSNLRLEAVVAVGLPAHSPKAKRYILKKFILKEL